MSVPEKITLVVVVIKSIHECAMSPITSTKYLHIYSYYVILIVNLVSILSSTVLMLSNLAPVKMGLTSNLPFASHRNAAPVSLRLAITRTL